jgi:RNA polymerase sigma-70 factor (ECF subfamily)
MQAIQGGDALAFEGFVREHERRFFRIALGYLGETEEARDAAQETFVRVWRSRGSWKEGTDPGVWARRILANHCIDRLRRRKVRAGPSLEEWEEARGGPAPAREGPDALGRAQAAQEGRLALEAVRRLPERMRVTVLMRFGQELTLQEVADAMGCSLGTVKATLHRALRRLRTILSAEEETRAAQG